MGKSNVLMLQRTTKWEKYIKKILKILVFSFFWNVFGDLEQFFHVFGDLS